jgi:uncharacterized membrane protein
MWFALAVLSAVVFGLAGLFMKVNQMRGGSVDHLLFGLYASGAAGFAANALAEGVPDWTDARIWLWGAAIGVLGSAWSNLVFMRALDCGPASMTSPLVNLNVALVALYATIVLREPLSAWEAAGIALLLAAVALLSVRRGEPLSVREKRWFALVALAIVLFAIRNGGLKITAESGLPNTAVLFVGYVLSMLWFAARARQSRKSASGGGHHFADAPPSTDRIVPVTYRFSGSAKNSAASAISSGVPR